MNGVSKSVDDTGKVFILTGSTASIDSYLLGSLLSNSGISHVSCLNRNTDSESLQRSRNKQRQLTYDLDASKVSFVKADLAKQNFGL